jgi:hypothetical protein
VIVLMESGQLSQNHFFESVVGLYSTAPPSKQSRILKSVVSCGDLLQLVHFLQTSSSRLSPSTKLDFFIRFVISCKPAPDASALKSAAPLFLDLIEQNAQPESFGDYAKSMDLFSPTLTDHDTVYDSLVRFSFESAIFPLTFLMSPVRCLNIRVCQVLFNVMQRLLSGTATAAWVESFLVFLSRGPDASISRTLLLDTLQSLLSRDDLSVGTRLQLLYYPAFFFSGEELVPSTNDFTRRLSTGSDTTTGSISSRRRSCSTRRSMIRRRFLTTFLVPRSRSS